MSVMTFEAVVKNGQVQVPPGILLPENARVYVVVPDLPLEQRAQIISPQLVYPEQSTHFQLQVREADDADV